MRDETTGPRTADAGLNRRQLLALGAGAGLTVASARMPGAWGSTAGHGGGFSDAFTLGVASGDPLPDSVVLWTRLAPKPLEGGGMPNRPVGVRWEIAKDERFRRVAARGVEVARPESAHAVHVEPRGLEPGREYYFRFKAGNELSPTGRTRTAPGPQADPRSLAFAFASCQMYEHGYFTAYRHMSEEDLDLVVHLGDYIYEYGPNEYKGRNGNPRLHVGPEIASLEDYRRRHAQYKTDADLQAAHGACPWIVTFDDHEVDNNWAADVPENTTDPGNASPEAFRARRAVAFQAYYEHMPLRRGQRPIGPDMLAYRRLTFGRLAEFSALDTRQYRSDQACGDGSKVDCAERLDPGRTLTGPAQERWLLGGLERSQARWNVIAQQVFMAQRDTDPGEPKRLSMDSWDGYVAGRDRLLRHVQTRGVSNPVVLTGDVHRSWVADLKADFDDPASATIGTELVGTSISSTGDGGEQQDAVLAANPHLRYFEDRRGYVRCTLDRRRWRADFRTLPYVSTPGAPVSTSASWVVEDGVGGARAA